MGRPTKWSTLEKARSVATAQLARLQLKIVDLVNEESVEQIDLETYSERLNIVFEKFSDAQTELMQLDESDIADESEVFGKQEDIYVSLITLLKNRLKSFGTLKTSSSSSSSGANLKLPKLDLPIFSGTYTEWMSFFDLFNAAVDSNRSISDSQKLQYLKSSLREEPLRLLSSLPITDSNYAIALKILTQRFENRKVLVREHIHSIFSFAPLKGESPALLRKLLETVGKSLMSLANLKIDTSSWDPVILYLMTERLDPETRKQWELQTSPSEIATLGELRAFLENRAGALEASKTVSSRSVSPKRSEAKKFQTHHVSAERACAVCKGPHRIYACNKFAMASQKDRSNLVREAKLCFNCLSPFHTSKDCGSSSTCKYCKLRHHSLLHIQKDSSPENRTLNSNSNQVCCENGKALLATACVPALGNNGSSFSCRALLDSGSETSFITETCAQRLGLKRSNHDATIHGIGGKVCSRTNGIVLLKLGADSNLEVRCVVLPKLTRSLPSAFFPIADLSLEHIRLADPFFNTPGSIDILLGADVYEHIVLESKIKIDSLFLRDTIFGWIASGCIATPDTHETLHSLRSLFASSENFDMKKFWELEELPNATQLSPEESACEAHFTSTTRRISDGRFEVKLPFASEPPPSLDFTLFLASRRLRSMERRFASDPEFKNKYVDFITEFLELGHLEPVPASEVHAPRHPVCYLPHHAVRKDSSTTTKLRVVFDGSASLGDGVSLNASLLVGPKIQDDLFQILLRFRSYEIALSADIAKMYRQTGLQLPDRDLHRIVWRSNASLPVKHFRMTRVTYGIASSAFHSVRSLQELAEVECDPIASPVIKKDFYVDDLLTGANDVKSALRLQQALIDVMTRGGCELRKWSSNTAELISHLAPELRENNDVIFDSSHTVKTLGIAWNPATDMFFFTFADPPEAQMTKRLLLSDTSRIFDPLGWLSPIVVVMKMLFQKCWVAGVEWDTVLPAEISDPWKLHRASVHALESLNVPRFALIRSFARTDLHVFCDSSEQAYAAAVYLVSYDEHSNASSFLLCSKTRVAPTKAVSIPRLELCAAHLGAKLVDSVKQTFAESHVKFSSVHAWTDSTVVLAWINALPRRWTTFVANRVSAIQETLPPSSWRHVPTAQNPADCASRGMSGRDLVSFELWWKGPPWLTTEQEYWPQPQVLSKTEIPESRKEKTVSLVVSMEPSLVDFSRFSSLLKLKRTLAYVLRFRSLALRKSSSSRPLTTDELENSMTLLVTLVQREYFGKEIALLSQEKTLPRTSKIRALAPFLDGNSNLVVGGRLQNADIPFSAKHPLLLPKGHVLSTLVARQAHQDCSHGGPQLTLARISEKFWIVNARDLVRKIVHSCVICFRYSRSFKAPLMGDLPVGRVTQNRPFCHVGLDYAGPFEIKTSSLRGCKTLKSYLALFVCFATKAVHLETVSDMTTEACLAALRRFVSRRGFPAVVYSDNGKNFEGAKNQLEKMVQFLNSQDHQAKVQNYFARNAIVWKLNPPSAPHFGGLWEAGVKGVKTHLRKIVGHTPLTFEELATVFAQIEACLNSRPLTLQSSDPNDPLPLTPGHFLTGDAILAMPQHDLLDHKTGRLQRWQLLQKMLQEFWSRWRLEYLNTLQPRKKWQTNNPDEQLAVGDVALLTDASGPGTWPLAVVSELHPGADGITRVVTVRVAGRYYKRPVHKLRRLPKDD